MTTEKDEVRALWECCFHDSREFTDLYFRARYTDASNLSLRKDGRLVSALQLIPYELACLGEVLPLAYVSGACTHPDYRKQGSMRALLAEAHRRMYADGIPVAALIPAEERLFDYYARSGYAPAFGYRVETIRREGLCPSATCLVETEGTLADDVFRYFDDRLRRRGNVVLHSRDDLRTVLSDLHLGGGHLLVAREAARPVGLAFVVPEDNGLVVKELLADDRLVRDALLLRALSMYREASPVLRCLLPDSSPAASPLGMLRVIHAGQLLCLYAHRHPEQECRIRLEGDEAIPANNGCYVLRDGLCRRKASLPSARTCTPAMLARLLVEAERPSMSLMMN